MPRVVVEARVAKPPDRVYALLSDMEQFPRFMPNLLSLTVVEKGEGYSITAWEALLQGARFRWRERDNFLPNRITYQQTEGDLKQFEGEWVLESDPDGTLVRLVTDFEFGIPMLSALLNPIAKVAIRENMRAMLQAIAQELKD